MNPRYLRTLAINDDLQKHISILQMARVYDGPSAQRFSKALVAVFGADDSEFRGVHEFLQKTSKHCESYEIDR